MSHSGAPPTSAAWLAPGVDATVRDREGNSVLDRAKQNGIESMVMLRKEPGAR